MVIGEDAKRILKLAGIRDVWAKTYNQTRTRMNYAYAVIDALKKTVLELGEHQAGRVAELAGAAGVAVARRVRDVGGAERVVVLQVS